MNTQIILSVLVGIAIGIGVTLIMGRYYVQKLVRQLTDTAIPSTPSKGNRSILLKRRSLITTAIIVGLAVITFGLMLPLGAEADEHNPTQPAVAGEIESPHYLFQYPGGWLTSGSNIYFSAGNVGIGTGAAVNPTEKLHVEGNIKLNGNITSDGDICIGTCN